MLLRAMPEPSTTEGRRIQGELKNLLEGAAVRRAESFASRRQGHPSEHRAATSRFMREASVYTGRTRNTAPAASGRLGNEHHHRDRRAQYGLSQYDAAKKLIEDFGLHVQTEAMSREERQRLRREKEEDIKISIQI